jgi:hypothetical protein
MKPQYVLSMSYIHIGSSMHVLSPCSRCIPLDQIPVLPPYFITKLPFLRVYMLAGLHAKHAAPAPPMCLRLRHFCNVDDCRATCLRLCPRIQRCKLLPHVRIYRDMRQSHYLLLLVVHSTASPAGEYSATHLIGTHAPWVLCADASCAATALV